MQLKKSERQRIPTKITTQKANTGNRQIRGKKWVQKMER